MFKVDRAIGMISSRKGAVKHVFLAHLKTPARMGQEYVIGSQDHTSSGFCTTFWHIPEIACTVFDSAIRENLGVAWQDASAKAS